MRQGIAIFIISAVLILLSALQIFAGQAGRLDPTFGTGGTVLHDVQNGEVNAIALQADGKIVLAGTRNNEFALFRLNASGTLDTSFGVNGMVRTTIATANSTGSIARDLIIQPDGKIIAVGRASRGNFIPPNTFSIVEVALVRYHQNGSLDTSFGGGDGIVTTLIGGGSSYGHAAELQADGKIVVAESKFAVIRYNADGSLDTTFGVNGIAQTDFGSGNSIAQDLKIQTDGKIVIAGYDNPPVESFVAAARYNTNGTLDTTFDGDGKLTASVAGFDRAYGLVIQADGKMLVVCTAATAFGAPQRLGLARFLPNGAFDTTFGTGGRVIAPANFGSAADIALQADGKIITSGANNWVFSTSNSDLTVARFLPDGSPDTSFDGDGLAIINLFVTDRADAVAIQPDGKIVAVGLSGAYLLAARFQTRPDTFADFDGDGKTDIAIFRPSVAEWWINRSSTGTTFAAKFGATTDRIVPRDYTGDGKADIAIWRPASGEWFILRSEDFSFFAFPFGVNGDVPTPADYDADGKADVAIFRPSSATWFITQSGAGGTRIFRFGVNGDQPVVSDYDSDGKADVGIFRPAASGAEWWINRSTAGLLAMQFGNSTDRPVQADYTGDGKTDIAIWRPSSGEWFILRSEDSSFFAFRFGANGDVVAPGDYDGDGKTDPTVFRPSQAMWYIARSTAGTQIVQFGANGDRPIPNAFVP